MRAICTSASLQTSIRVSPDFILFRHSSPPFGSKQAHSTSTPRGPGGVGHSKRVHTMRQVAPFQYERSTGNNIFPLARLFDSLVRVSRRVKAPHFRVANIEFTEKRGLAGFDAVHPALSPPNSPLPHFRTWLPSRRVRPADRRDNASRPVLAKMEVLSLSLSRLQVLCHSLSKVLFKLSLTLLVRYRSSYSVFNFGRHIPAA